MYKVYIDGSYLGHFRVLEKAMIEVDRWAKKVDKSWKIINSAGEIHAQSDNEPANDFSKAVY